MHRLKKLDVVVESERLQDVLDIIQNSGAKGYTIYEISSGEGKREIRQDIMAYQYPYKSTGLYVIAPEDVAKGIAQRIYSEILGGSAGILFLSDVEVMRKDHF